MVGVNQGWQQSILVWGCSAIALTYAVMSGYWGVVVTDLMQFAIAMVGSIFLAVVAFSKLGGFGGIQEKIIAARRAGIKELILPEDNQGDFEEIPEHVRKGIKVHFATTFDDVMPWLFSR